MKKILTFVVLTFVPLSVSAWENCGKIKGADSNCEFEISEDGVLTIRPIDSTKDGIMPDYNASNPLFPGYCTSAPWAEDGYNNIIKIEILDGIQNVGKDAFIQLSLKLTTVDMANSVTKIGYDSFANLPNLSEVTLPENLLTLGQAFQDSASLHNINLPESLTEIQGNPFMRSGITSLTIPDSVINNEGYDVGLLTSFSNITTVYCSKKKEKACSALVEAAKTTGKAKEGLKYELYEKYGNEYIYNGKFFSKLGDIGTTNHIKKRIYTIDEANKIAGKKNRFSIKYR